MNPFHSCFTWWCPCRNTMGESMNTNNPMSVMMKNIHRPPSCTDGMVDGQPIRWNDAEPFVPPIDSGLVVKVYDGDTLTIVAKMPYEDSKLYRFSVRLSRS